MVQQGLCEPKGMELDFPGEDRRGVGDKKEIESAITRIMSATQRKAELCGIEVTPCGARHAEGRDSQPMRCGSRSGR